MAKQLVLKGDTSRSELLFIQAATKTDGSGATGLSATQSGLVAYYVRPIEGVTAITLTTTTGSATNAWETGGLKELFATRMPGLYRLDIPDAVFATGADKAVVMLWGAATFTTQIAPVLLEYQLVSFDPENAQTLGLSGFTATELSSMPGAATLMAVETQFIYQSLRNRRDSGTASQNMYTDGGSVFATATQSDSGSLFVKGKFG